MPITSTTWVCDNPMCAVTGSGSAEEPPTGWRKVCIMAMYFQPGQAGVLCPDCVGPIARALPPERGAPGTGLNAGGTLDAESASRLADACRKLGTD